jgi:predicted nucleotidyltransferase
MSAGSSRRDSDLDLLIYGAESCKTVYRALVDLLRKVGGSIRRLEQEELQDLHAVHKSDTPLTFHDFAQLQRRKVNAGRCRERAFFLWFFKQPEEFGERYGDRHYHVVGRATIRASIDGGSDAIFSPYCYRVQEATVLEGPQVDNLREIVTFRVRFSDQL